MSGPPEGQHATNYSKSIFILFQPNISFISWINSSNIHKNRIDTADTERSTWRVIAFTAHLAPPPPSLCSAVQVSHDWAVPRAAVCGIYIQQTLTAKRRRSTVAKLHHTLFTLSTPECSIHLKITGIILVPAALALCWYQINTEFWDSTLTHRAPPVTQLLRLGWRQKSEATQ